MGFEERVFLEPGDLFDWQGPPDDNGESLLAARFESRDRLFLAPGWRKKNSWQPLVLVHELMNEDVRTWFHEALLGLREGGVVVYNIGHCLQQRAVVLEGVRIGSVPSLALSLVYSGFGVEPFNFGQPIVEFVPVSRYDARVSMGLPPG